MLADEWLQVRYAQRLCSECQKVTTHKIERKKDGRIVITKCLRCFKPDAEVVAPKQRDDFADLMAAIKAIAQIGAEA